MIKLTLFIGGVISANINPKYGNDPGMIYYSHTSDKYAPFSMQLITSNVRDSTYVLDGLLHHEADLNITEHYTDTAGFTDHVFAMMNFIDKFFEIKNKYKD